MRYDAEGPGHSNNNVSYVGAAQGPVGRWPQQVSDIELRRDVVCAALASGQTISTAIMNKYVRMIKGTEE